MKRSLAYILKLWWHAECVHEVSLPKRCRWQHSSKCTYHWFGWRLPAWLFLPTCHCSMYRISIFQFVYCINRDNVL